MDIPLCCGKRMKKRVETPTFLALQCSKCNEMIYIKKGRAEKPVMLDD